jgi:hypothetical protein
MGREDLITVAKKATTKKRGAAGVPAAGKKKATKKAVGKPVSKIGAKKKVAKKPAARRAAGKVATKKTTKQPAPKPRRAGTRPTVDPVLLAAWRMERQGLDQQVLHAPRDLAEAVGRTGWLAAADGFRGSRSSA